MTALVPELIGRIHEAWRWILTSDRGLSRGLIDWGRGRASVHPKAFALFFVTDFGSGDRMRFFPRSRRFFCLWRVRSWLASLIALLFSPSGLVRRVIFTTVLDLRATQRVQRELDGAPPRFLVSSVSRADLRNRLSSLSLSCSRVQGSVSGFFHGV